MYRYTIKSIYIFDGIYIYTHTRDIFPSLCRITASGTIEYLPESGDEDFQRRFRGELSKLFEARQ